MALIHQFLKKMGDGIFWTLHGIAVVRSTLKRKLNEPTMNIVENTQEDEMETVPKLCKSYTGLIRPGDFIKHHTFMDVACKVYSVGCLEVGATEIQVHFIWYNQGFEKSWCINEYGYVSIPVNKLHEWFLCVDPNKDQCLRKCDWIPLGYEDAV